MGGIRGWSDKSLTEGNRRQMQIFGPTNKLVCFLSSRPPDCWANWWTEQLTDWLTGWMFECVGLPIGKLKYCTNIWKSTKICYLNKWKSWVPSDESSWQTEFNECWLQNLHIRKKNNKNKRKKFEKRWKNCHFSVLLSCVPYCSCSCCCCYC